MKKRMMTSLVALLLGGQVASAADLPVHFKPGTRTPVEVQEFMTRLFNQKCAGAVLWASKHYSAAYTTYEDDYLFPEQTQRTAVYEVAYDHRYPRDMVAVIHITFKKLKSGRAKVLGAEVLMGYDSTHCDKGKYAPSDIE